MGRNYQQGKEIITTALQHARDQLQDQATIPVIDAMRVNSRDEVIEEFALSLFPIVREEDISQFFGDLEKIAA